MLAVGIAVTGGVALSEPSHVQRATLGSMSAQGVYLFGKVILDDGTSVPDSVAIERVRNGTVRREGLYRFQRKV